MSRYLRNRPRPYRGPNYSLRRWVLLALLATALIMLAVHRL